MSADAQLEQYVNDVTSQLAFATRLEREEIASKIQTQICERADRRGESVESVLARVESPEKVAEQYRDILTASRSYSPLVLLKASFRRGVPGVLAALIGVAGYWLGGFLLVFGTLALIWAATHAGAHKPVPIGSTVGGILKIFASGCFFMVFTTLLLRATLRLFRHRLLRM
jgi:hypothetical protein